jgi:peptidyl-Lys metalloendopeptidase
MSHFTAVAGTDDRVYGQAAAATLAGSDPDRAIDNADSHEYFGENDPYRTVRPD